MRIGLAVLFLFIASAMAQARDTRAALIAWWQCPVAAAFKAVYALSREDAESGRFLTISVRNNPRAYVRCRFADDNSKFQCEASQAYYEEGNAHPLYVFMPRERIAAMERLGFDAGAVADLTYSRTIGTRPDFDALTSFVLTALHDGFGAREETALDVDAPLQGGLITACLR